MTTISPPASKTAQQTEILIDADHLTDLEGQTIIHIRYVAPSYYVNGGWISIHPTTYLIGPDGSKLQMVAAYNIPVSPDVFQFSRCGEVRRFTLVFPRVPGHWGRFMMREECGSGNGFIIRDIEPRDSGVYSFTIRYSRD